MALLPEEMMDPSIPEYRRRERLRTELNELLRKQRETLETRMLGTASDSELLEYEIRQEIIHQICNELAHSLAA
jgi:tRNA(Ile)-lysidine synthase TilS/MesJ